MREANAVSKYVASFSYENGYKTNMMKEVADTNNQAYRDMPDLYSLVEEALNTNEDVGLVENNTNENCSVLQQTFSEIQYVGPNEDISSYKFVSFFDTTNNTLIDPTNININTNIVEETTTNSVVETTTNKYFREFIANSVLPNDNTDETIIPNITMPKNTFGVGRKGTKMMQRESRPTSRNSSTSSSRSSSSSSTGSSSSDSSDSSEGDQPENNNVENDKSKNNSIENAQLQITENNSAENIENDQSQIAETEADDDDVLITEYLDDFNDFSKIYEPREFLTRKSKNKGKFSKIESIDLKICNDKIPNFENDCNLKGVKSEQIKFTPYVYNENSKSKEIKFEDSKVEYLTSLKKIMNKARVGSSKYSAHVEKFISYAKTPKNAEVPYLALKLNSTNFSKMDDSYFLFALGHIDSRYVKVAETFVEHILNFQNLYLKNNKKTLNKKENCQIYNFSNSDLELFLYSYYNLYNQDLVEYNELIARPGMKKIFLSLISKLKKNKKINTSFKFQEKDVNHRDIIGVLINLADINDDEKITIESLYWLKYNFEYILNCSTNKSDWFKFMSSMNIHHYLCFHTLNECIKKSIEFIKHLEHINLQFEREKKIYFVSPLQKKNKNVFEKKFISELFNKYFPESQSVSDELLVGFNNVIFAFNISLVNFFQEAGWDDGEVRESALNAFEKAFFVQDNVNLTKYLGHINLPTSIIKDLISHIEDEIYFRKNMNTTVQIKNTLQKKFSDLYNSFIGYVFGLIFMNLVQKHDTENDYNPLFLRAIEKTINDLFSEIDFDNRDWNEVLNKDHVSEIDEDYTLDRYNDFISREKDALIEKLEEESEMSDFCDEDMEIDDDELNDLQKDLEKTYEIQSDITRKHPKRTYTKRNTKRKLDEELDETDKIVPVKRKRNSKNYPTEIVDHFKLKKLDKQSKCTCSFCGFSKTILYSYELTLEIETKVCSDCLILLKNGEESKWKEIIALRFDLITREKYHYVTGKKIYAKRYIKAPIAFKNDKFIEYMEDTVKTTTTSYNLKQKNTKQPSEPKKRKPYKKTIAGNTQENFEVQITDVNCDNNS